MRTAKGPGRQPLRAPEGVNLANDMRSSRLWSGGTMSGAHNAVFES